MRSATWSTFKSVSGRVVVAAVGSLVLAGGDQALAQSGSCTTDCYVATTGLDTNTGQADAPFLTIQHALDVVAAGGTVHVAAGAYNPNVNNVTKSVTLRGAQYGADTTGRDPDDATTESIITANTGFWLKAGAGTVVIDGFTLKQKGTGGVGVSNDANVGTSVTVSHNIFAGVGIGAGLKWPTGTGSLDISENWFAGTGTGIQLSDGSTTAALSVRDNTFTNTVNRGISMGTWLYPGTIDGNSFDATADQGAIFVGCDGCSVSNNTITNGASFYGIQVTNSSVDVLVTGNTITHQRGAFSTPGIGVQVSFATGTTVTGNTISDVDGSAIRIYEFAASTTVEGNTLSGPGTYGVFADWLFDDPAGWLDIDSNDIAGVTYGVALEYPATVTRNVITDTTTGIEVRTGGDTIGTHITQNGIAGNTAGMSNIATNTVDGTCNWWGAADGPSGTGPGAGDSVSAKVDFAPWLPASTLSDPCDETPPVITITTPTDGATYARASTVPANFACTDTGSGVTTCVGDVANSAAIDTSTLGAHTFTVHATDTAGNASNLTVDYEVEPAGPAVTVTTPAEGATYLQNTTVVADFACTPGDAAIVHCTGDVADGTAIDTSTAGARTFTVEAEDANRLTASVTVYYTVRAPIGPAVTVTTPAEGATYLRNATVLADFACTPADGAIVSCTGDVTDGAAIDTSTVGPHTFVVEAEDANGLTASVTVHYTVRAAVPSRVSVTSPRDRGVYLQGERVIAGYACAPGDLPVASCTGNVADGRAIDTSTLGLHTFTVVATDTSGLTTSVTVRYSIVAPPPQVTSTPSPTPAPGGPSLYTYTLSFRWTLITWMGIDGLSVSDALRGEGQNAAGNSIISSVTVVFAYEPGANGPGRWRAYFPGKDAIPGANDLGILRNGNAYWIAIVAPGATTWVVRSQ